MEIAVQINSKIVARMDVETNLSEDELIEKITTDEKVAPLLLGKQIIKKIVVPKRLVNLIVK